MRSVPPLLQEDLDAGVQTLCQVLLIEPLNSDPVGFADLDIDLELDLGAGPQLFSGKQGFLPSDLVARAGMGVDTMEAKTLVPGFALPFNPRTLAAGLLDEAPFRVLLLNYRDPSRGFAELLTGTVGRVWNEDESAALIELRSLSTIARQANVCERDSLTCRVRRFGSQAGQERFPCFFDVEPLWQAGTVSAAGGEPDRVFETTDAIVEAFDPGPGMLRWTTGANVGREWATQALQVNGGTVTITLVDPVPFDIEPGDEFEWRDDCDRSWQSCKARGNIEWFRGEPKIRTSDAGQNAMPGASTDQGRPTVPTAPVGEDQVQ